MIRSSKLVLLTVLIACSLVSIEGKNLLLHSVQYHLSPEKLFFMVQVNNCQSSMPLYIILEPILNQKSSLGALNQLIPPVPAPQLQNRTFLPSGSTQPKTHFDFKLKVPLKIVIDEHDEVSQQCFFNQSWDLCLIKNPIKNKTLHFSIHCLMSTKSNVSQQECNGKILVRQSNSTKIAQTQRNINNEKLRYNSGLFSLSHSSKHSVLMVSCEDAGVPSKLSELKIYSTLRFYRYSKYDGEEVRELVGLDRNQQNPTQFAKTKGEFNFIYFSTTNDQLKQCLQFDFYFPNRISSEQKIFDFINLADSSYQNIYQIEKSTQNNPSSVLKKLPAKQLQPLFKYNALLSFNIFLPRQIFNNQINGLNVNLINLLNLSVAATFQLLLEAQNKSGFSQNFLNYHFNHYNFVFVVGHQILKSFNSLSVEISFEEQEAHQKSFSTNQLEYFFFSLSVEDSQSVSVQKLATTRLALKNSDHITFLIKSPYEFKQKADQKLSSFNDLLSIKPSSQNLQIAIFQYQTDHVHISECHYTKGCKFQLDAKADCLDCKISYETDFKLDEVYLLIFERNSTFFQGKIDFDQTQYYYKEFEPQEIVQFNINTPNLIVYTLENDEDYNKCRIPKKSCNTQIATSRQMIILSNANSSQRHKVYFAFQGLDKTRFSIFLIKSTRVIGLENGIPFTYRLSTNKNFMEFSFEVPGYKSSHKYNNNITFNLIAPLNSFTMKIYQLSDGKNLQAQIKSTESISGYAKLSAKSLKSSKLKITIQKSAHYLKHALHFTLIVSTSDHKFHLDNGITHYETFDSNESKSFLVEYEKNHMNELSLHFSGPSKKNEISFLVSVFDSHESKSTLRKPLRYSINTLQWVLILDDQLLDKNNLCTGNDPECTIFISMSNLMSQKVSLSMTLLAQDSVIELKDGIWQTFQLDQLLVQTHFYFIPTHMNSIKVFFKSSHDNLFLSAVLYDNSQNANPVEWPFPETHGHEKEQIFYLNQSSMLKSNHLLQVDEEDSYYKKCFPHCVVLFSIFESQKSIKNKNKNNKQRDEQSQTEASSLSILASNGMIELLENMRMNIELKQQEEQLLFIDLKNVLSGQEQKTLTFFTNLIAGYAQVYGKIYLPSLQNIPDLNSFDYAFEDLKTQISKSSIRQIFIKSIAPLKKVGFIEQVLVSQSLYLALLIKAYDPTSIALQYSTNYSEITDLHIESEELISLQPFQEKLLQFCPTTDQKIRFIRSRGSPLFHQFQCFPTKNGYDVCLHSALKKLRHSSEKYVNLMQKHENLANVEEENSGLRDKVKEQLAFLSKQKHQYQVLKKTQTKQVIECQQCIVFIWIYAVQLTQLAILLQSLKTEILLKENQMINDFIQPEQYHRYYLPRVQNQDTRIVVSYYGGSPLVTVKDNSNFKQTKSGDDSIFNQSKVIFFSIPPVKSSQHSLSSSSNQASKSSFNTIFSTLHISITPQTSDSLTYQITYFSGVNKMFLKNGILSTQILFQNQTTTFSYKNQKKSSKSYFTLTVEGDAQTRSRILKGIQIKFFFLAINPSTKESFRGELAPQSPTTSQKFYKVKTTLTYQIPPFENLEIQIQSDHSAIVTVGIINRMIVFLPINYEYPVFLDQNEQLKLVVDNLEKQSQIEFSIKKCDQSNPFIFYTTEEKQFQLQSYSNYVKFGTERIYKQKILTANSNTALYIKLKAESKKSSVLSVRVQYVQRLNKKSLNMNPGNMGLIRYKFEGFNSIRLSLNGLQCAEQCYDLVDYYLVEAKSVKAIQNWVICAGDQTIKISDKQKLKTIEKSVGTPKEKVQSFSQSLKVTKIEKPQKQSNTITLLIPFDSAYPILTVKAVHTQNQKQSYYKMIEPQTLQSMFSNYSSYLLLSFAGVLLLGLVCVVWLTRKIARKGYVHVGSEETMIV